MKVGRRFEVAVPIMIVVADREPVRAASAAASFNLAAVSLTRSIDVHFSGATKESMTV